MDRVPDEFACAWFRESERTADGSATNETSSSWKVETTNELTDLTRRRQVRAEQIDSLGLDSGWFILHGTGFDAVSVSLSLGRGSSLAVVAS